MDVMVICGPNQLGPSLGFGTDNQPWYPYRGLHEAWASMRYSIVTRLLVMKNLYSPQNERRSLLDRSLVGQCNERVCSMRHEQLA